MMKSLLAAAVIPALMVPQTPALVVPKPAIIRAESKKVLLAMPLTMGMLPGKAAAGTPAASYNGNYGSSTGATTYTTGTITFGTTDAKRVLVACFCWLNSTTRTVSSVTIGGTSATAVSGSTQTGSAGGQSTYYLADASTVSGTVSVTLSGAGTAFVCYVYSVYPSSSTPTGGGFASSGSTTSLASSAFSASSGGVIVGAEYTPATAPTIGFTSNVGTPTLVGNQTVGTAQANGALVTGISSSASATLTTTLSSSSAARMTCAAWGP